MSGETLIETIPEDLFQKWRKWPMLLIARHHLPIVELADRTITLQWWGMTIQSDVANCNYRWGRPWRMKHNSRNARPFFSFGKHDLILIDFPPLHRGIFGGIWSYNTAPVGYTQKSLVCWEATLRKLLGDFENRDPPTED